MTAAAIEDDMFADPEPAKREITYDGWGRYRLPHPDTGKEVGITRVTTVAGALEDQFNLKMWDRRKMLEGLVIDRGPLVLAAQVFKDYGWDPQSREAKDKLDDIAKHILDIADSNAGAKTGTLLHSITEDHNQGEFIRAGQRAAKAGVSGNMLAYVDALARYEIEVLPRYMERVVFIRELNAVGRLDNLTTEMGQPLMRVFDLKSQKSMDWGALKIAIQLAMYANAEAMFNEDTWTWEEMPPVDKEIATVCWLPVLKDQEEKLCQLYDVDLEWGWKWAKASVKVRTARKNKPLTLRVAPSRSLALAAPAVVLEPKPEPEPEGMFRDLTEEDINKVAAGFDVAAKERVFGPHVTEDLTLDAPPVVASGRVVLVPVQNGEPKELDWSARFRQAGTTQELVRVGKECVESGAMTKALKELGNKIRDEINARQNAS